MKNFISPVLIMTLAMCTLIQVTQGMPYSKMNEEMDVESRKIPTQLPDKKRKFTDSDEKEEVSSPLTLFSLTFILTSLQTFLQQLFFVNLYLMMKESIRNISVI